MNAHAQSALLQSESVVLRVRDSWASLKQKHMHAESKAIEEVVASVLRVGRLRCGVKRRPCLGKFGPFQVDRTMCVNDICGLERLNW